MKTVPESGEVDASVTEKHVGTNNPYVKVHWWSTAWDYVEYTLAVYIKGTKGTNCIEGIQRGKPGPKIMPKGDCLY
ncbi:MAG: hypothetical protein JSW70_04275 [Syntrophobacterales bacterium]|nr:MAG: hypothetical protein JSW70_04275 [Syntrophobacterales bacterium]